MHSDHCDACGAGMLVARKQYRLHPGWVAVGYVWLSLSALAFLFAVGMLVVIWAVTQAGLPAQAQADMERARVPAYIQAKVADRKPIPEADLRALTADQRKAVRDGQSHMSAQTLVFGFGAFLFGISAAILAALALPGLLAGWMLVLRRRVAVCDRCGAVTG